MTLDSTCLCSVLRLWYVKRGTNSADRIAVHSSVLVVRISEVRTVQTVSQYIVLCLWYVKRGTNSADRIAVHSSVLVVR
jgi:hypothetical protein